MFPKRPRTTPDTPLARLRLRGGADSLIVPEVIEIPVAGKLRLGAHPPYMDRRVGRSEFSRLPFVDIRGDVEAVHDLSRHVACVWCDSSGACFVQLGWPGPGEAIRPRGQSRILRFGREHDATSQPFRLMHRDVVRLGSRIEYVFLELASLADRSTPEQKKIEALGATLARV